MKKLIFLFLSIPSLGAFAQTEPIAPEYVRTDSIASFTNNEDLKLVGRGTGGVNIEGEYTLPKVDGDGSEVFKTDGSGNITLDSVTFAELQGIDTVLTISDTVSTLATPYDLTQIQGYTVANSANNRVITSVDSENGNAEANLTFDGTDLNIVTGGLDIGGTEVISSGRAFSATTGTFSGDVLISNGAAGSSKNITILSGNGNNSILDLIETTSGGLFGSNGTFGFRHEYDGAANVYNIKVGEQTTITTALSIDRATKAITASSLAGTGTRLTTASSTGGLGTIANGTDGQVMTMVSGSPAWDDIVINNSNWSGTDLSVSNGGTGRSSATAYAPIFGGTTSTGALQSGAVGTSGQVLTSNGAGAIATFQDPTGDVTGPGSSTDEAIVRFDGTSGEVIQNQSVVKLTDAGDFYTDSQPSPGVEMSFDATNDAVGRFRVTTSSGTNMGFVSQGSLYIQATNGVTIDDNTILNGDLGATGSRVTIGYFTDITSTNAVNVDSDIRLKKNVKTIKSGIDVIGEINPVSYKWKDRSRGKGKHYGVIAQELKEVLPDLVNDTGENLAVAYTELIPFLIKAIQEQQQQIENLKNQINQ